MFILHAFNARGEQLYRNAYPPQPSLVPVFGEADEYDTIIWAAGRVNGLKSGYRVDLSDGSGADYDAPVTWVRNRIAFFRVLHNSIVIARIDRESADYSAGNVSPVVDRDLSGDGRYRVGKEGTGAPRAQYVARFCGGFISAHDDALDAYAACREHRAGVRPDVARTRDEMASGRWSLTSPEPFDSTDTGAVLMDGRHEPRTVPTMAMVTDAADRPERHPMWGELDSVFAVFVAHADEINRVGFAVYAADGNGRASGEQIDFVGPVTLDGRNLYAYLEDAGYGIGEQSADIVNFRQRLVVTADEWERLTFAANWPATSEKFSNGLAERLYAADMDGGADETLGDSEGFGYYALFSGDNAILTVNSQGFVAAMAHGSERAVRDAWEELGRDFERWSMAVMEDALPTSECDGIFLIFDGARHIGTVPDRDTIEEHVRECDVCGEYRYVLDEY